MSKKSEIQIFLAHANEDKKRVREIYHRLKELGYRPWLDEVDILPGLNWEQEIQKAIRDSQIFMACFSQKSIGKDGYIQKELRIALDKLAEKPPNTIFVIPLRLEDCQLPDLQQTQLGIRLRSIQWLDYWNPNSFERLERSIEYQFGSFNEVEEPKDVSLPDKPLLSDYLSIPSLTNKAEIKLKSDRGIDYTKLRNLLAEGKWKEADQETGKVMCQAAGREEQGWLDIEDIDNFPCEDLRTIDQLWLYYSQGKFGFSVQKKIYESLGGTREYNQEVWKNFCNRIGWRKGGSWLYYSVLTFNLESAPQAHLPCSLRWEGGFTRRWVWKGATLFSRKDL